MSSTHRRHDQSIAVDLNQACVEDRELAWPARLRRASRRPAQSANANVRREGHCVSSVTASQCDSPIGAMRGAALAQKTRVSAIFATAARRSSTTQIMARGQRRPREQYRRPFSSERESQRLTQIICGDDQELAEAPLMAGRFPPLWVPSGTFALPKSGAGGGRTSGVHHHPDQFCQALGLHLAHEAKPVDFHGSRANSKLEGDRLICLTGDHAA